MNITPEFADRMNNLDAFLDRVTAPAPFRDSKIRPTPIERVVADVIWQHKGRENPVSIATLCAHTRLSERSIKGIVEQLVSMHRIQIGGKRTDPVGYFVIVDAEDQNVACRAYRKQIFAMWRRLRVLETPHALRELHGQLTIVEGDPTI